MSKNGISLTRNQAHDQASKLADDTFKKTWVVRTEGGEPHSYQNVPGYEVRTEKPGVDEDVYRQVLPSPIYNSIDNVTLVIVKECGYVRVRAEFETLALADAYVARFPKSLKMRSSRISGSRTIQGAYSQWAFVGADIQLRSNGVNKGVNESGLSRLHRIQKLAPHVIFNEETNQ